MEDDRRQLILRPRRFFFTLYDTRLDVIFISLVSGLVVVPFPRKTYSYKYSEAATPEGPISALDVHHSGRRAHSRRLSP